MIEKIIKDLMEKLLYEIKKEENQTIIDVFGGSRTTSKVANDLGFDSVSYEIDEKYCDIIKNRLNQ